MTPLEYAKLCADRYPQRKVKGRGHVPRVLVDRHHPFQKLLPCEKVCKRHDGDDYSAEWYTATATYHMFSDDLTAAGIDIITGEIISELHWTAAQAVVRLTREPYDHAATIAHAADVRALIEVDADRDLSRALRAREL